LQIEIFLNSHAAPFSHNLFVDQKEQFPDWISKAGINVTGVRVVENCALKEQFNKKGDKK